MPEWVRVAAAEDIPAGEKIAVAVTGEEIAIFNVDGTLYAIGDICTHAEASLSEGDFYDEIVECPLHGSMFDVTTGRVSRMLVLSDGEPSLERLDLFVHFAKHCLVRGLPPLRLIHPRPTYYVSASPTSLAATSPAWLIFSAST